MSVKFSDVEFDKITANKYLQHLLVNYENKRFLIQTDWMTLTHYGIPKNDKFHPTEESRRYLQIPLNDDKFNNCITLGKLYFQKKQKSSMKIRCVDFIIYKNQYNIIDYAYIYKNNINIHFYKYISCYFN